MKCRPFKPGDIAIFQNLQEPFTYINGEVCEVLSPLSEFNVIDIFATRTNIVCYKVLHGSMVVGVLPEHLKHKEEPENTISEHECTVIEV